MPGQSPACLASLRLAQIDVPPDLAEKHDELMNSIMLEEENLVAFHRAKLEEDMETMRQVRAGARRKQRQRQQQP